MSVLEPSSPPRPVHQAFQLHPLCQPAACPTRSYVTLASQADVTLPSPATWNAAAAPSPVSRQEAEPRQTHSPGSRAECGRGSDPCFSVAASGSGCPGRAESRHRQPSPCAPGPHLGGGTSTVWRGGWGWAQAGEPPQRGFAGSSRMGIAGPQGLGCDSQVIGTSQKPPGWQAREPLAEEGTC